DVAVQPGRLLEATALVLLQAEAEVVAHGKVLSGALGASLRAGKLEDDSRAKGGSPRPAARRAPWTQRAGTAGSSGNSWTRRRNMLARAKRQSENGASGGSRPDNFFPAARLRPFPGPSPLRRHTEGRRARGSVPGRVAGRRWPLAPTARRWCRV